MMLIMQSHDHKLSVMMLYNGNLLAFNLLLLLRHPILYCFVIDPRFSVLLVYVNYT